MEIPEHLVPVEFRARVTRELREARRRAMSLLPEVIWENVGPTGRPRRHCIVPKTCVGCLGPHSELTPGCHQCEARHWARGNAAKNKGLRAA